MEVRLKECDKCYWMSTDLYLDTGWCDLEKWKRCKKEDLFVSKEEVNRIESKGW